MAEKPKRKIKSVYQDPSPETADVDVLECGHLAPHDDDRDDDATERLCPVCAEQEASEQ